MSKRSYQLHKQLIFSLALQFAVPGIALALPFAVLLYELVYQSGAMKRKKCCLRQVKVYYVAI